MRTPAFETCALVTDDAAFAAQVSSFFRRPGRYFPVLDGPRMTRPDHASEVVRRRNALVQTGARQVVIGKLPTGAAAAVGHRWRHCASADDVDTVAAILRGLVRRPERRLDWGSDNLGIGLYKARMANCELAINQAASPVDSLVLAGRHLLVACERGEVLSEVIASNIAFAFGASYATFAGISEQTRDDWIEELYALGESREVQSEFQELVARARAHLGEFDFTPFRMVLWITSGFPWGIATPEVPTTHMRNYPDFGRAVVEGMWTSQSAERTSRTALLIDPGTVSSSEIPAVNRALLRNGTLTHMCVGRSASVRRVQQVTDLLPHDIIILSSHAGDAPGERLTYEFPDAENRLRRLVVDEAVGFGYDAREGKFQVTQYNRFHSLDGIDWRDKAGKTALPVGSAMTTWAAAGDTIEWRANHIVHRESISRVIGSMGIQLNDGTWFFISHGFTPGAAPLIINNSCWSWHDIAERATFAGARGYVGCLVPILGPEAQGIAEAMFGRYLGLPLPLALWSAQRDVYGNSMRRPYVMVGLPCISIQANSVDSASFMRKAYLDGIAHWTRVVRDSREEYAREHATRSCEFLIREMQEFQESLVRRRMPS